MATPTNDFEVIDPELMAKIAKIGDLLRAATPAGYVFAFLFASIGEQGVTFYTSNGNREDIVKLLREMIRKIERN